MESPLVRLARLSVLAVTIATCRDATGPTVDQILANRALWSAQSLTDYSYQYEVTGFFINWEGQEIALDVRNGTVATAVFVATGQPVPGPATEFPTIDALFDRAVLAVGDHKLKSITFDPLLHYPVRMDLAGPPDASGSVFAAHLEPSP